MIKYYVPSFTQQIDHEIYLSNYCMNNKVKISAYSFYCSVKFLYV